MPTNIYTESKHFALVNGKVTYRVACPYTSHVESRRGWQEAADNFQWNQINVSATGYILINIIYGLRISIYASGDEGYVV